jgi:rhodanese-related sulfurtransferase
MTLLLMINIKTLLLLAVITIIAVSCARFLSRGGNNNNPQLPPPFITVGVEEFQNLIADPAVQLLDVREQDEYDNGHIAGAKLVDVNGSDFLDKALAVLDPARPVAVYCRSGRRSARAASLLADKGFSVTNLDGGVLAWQDAGKALIR